ncbi:hypothetical protein ACFVGM_08945 [Kitasatospora purpeofusca]|uniref:hypothetical protein n=1 Tax=Kitasatospora purpeofusca TaxID=67352 RepID=UPI003691D0FD
MPTTAGTSSYAALPYPGDVQVPDVPADVKTLAARLDVILQNVFGGTAGTPMPTAPITPGILAAAAAQGGFQSQLTAQGTSVAILQGQVATLQAQVATLQSQITVLQRTPTAYARAYPSYLKLNGGMTGTPPVLLNTVTVPSAGYRQLLLAQAQSTWDQIWDQTSAPLLQQLFVNGEQRSACFQNGFEISLHDLALFTVEPGNSTTFEQYISVPEYWDSRPEHEWQTIYAQPRLYAIALPWTGAVVAETA